jgi:hypothetical protein
LSIFLSNPKHVGEIIYAKIVQNDQIIKIVSLHKNGEFIYSSDRFFVPFGEFKIFIEGSDSNKNPILREFPVNVIPKPSPKNVEKIEIPDGVTQVIFTAKGKNQSLKVYDSSGKEYVGSPLENDPDTEIIIIKNPSVGTWTVHSKHGFSHSIEIENENPFDYGFSLEIPNRKKDTSQQPIFGKFNQQ